MALFDSFASRLSRPAGRMLDAPIRDIVHELLNEHGYASPAEVQALRDELRGLRGRVDGLDRKVTELAGIADAARAEASAARAAAASPAPHEHAVPAHEHPVPTHEHAPDARIAALEARIAELEARPAAVSAAAEAPAPAPAEAPAAAAPAPLSADTRGGCKVPGCDEALRSKGFCSAHYQQWRRGTLKSFVTADGTALVDGRVVHLPKGTIGGLVTLQGDQLFVDGAAVRELPAS